MKIKEVIHHEEKSSITNDILRSLPNWFGIDESIINYVNEAKEYIFYACFDGSKAIGFIALKIHNKYTAEIAVMGILKEYHRKGIGRKLISICEDILKKEKYQFLTVKTLDDSRINESYSKTREFYKSIGFIPLEVFKTLWDENNPCLFLCKVIE